MLQAEGGDDRTVRTRRQLQQCAARGLAGDGQGAVRYGVRTGHIGPPAVHRLTAEALEEIARTRVQGQGVPVRPGVNGGTHAGGRIGHHHHVRKHRPQRLIERCERLAEQGGQRPGIRHPPELYAAIFRDFASAIGASRAERRDRLAGVLRPEHGPSVPGAVVGIRFLGNSYTAAHPCTVSHEKLLVRVFANEAAHIARGIVHLHGAQAAHRGRQHADHVRACGLLLLHRGDGGAIRGREQQSVHQQRTRPEPHVQCRPAFHGQFRRKNAVGDGPQHGGRIAGPDQEVRFRTHAETGAGLGKKRFRLRVGT